MEQYHTLDITESEVINDNRNINDAGANQKMSYEEIEFKKSKGVTGEDLINEIVKNSSTFDQRTIFSKEKYLKKLKKRHINLVELRYPSLHNICEYAYELQESRYVTLRFDALAYILNSSNISYTSKVLVVENTNGLVTAGLVERMNNQGSLTKLSLQDNPIANLQSQVSYMFKMNNVDGNNITFINYKDLVGKNNTTTMKCIGNRMKEQFTSWVLVHDKHSPKDLWTMVHGFLKPSWYVTVFWEFLQPLAELERHIRNSHIGIMILLEDFWTREYQILPLRTHPHMVTTNDSGYVLTFITVQPGK